MAETTAEPTTPAKAKKGFPKRNDLAYKRGSGERLYLRVDADGVPNWEGVNKEDREKFKAVLQSPLTVKELGIEAPQVELPPPTLSPETVGVCLDVLCGAEGFLIAKFKKAPTFLVKECFSLDETEKALLIPPAQKLADKYSPDFLKKYADEANFLAVWLMITQSKMQILKVRMAEEAEKFKAKQAAAQAESQAEMDAKPIDVDEPMLTQTDHVMQ